MVAAACYTLAVIHLLAWLRSREYQGYLAFAAVAAGIGTTTLIEMSAMSSTSVANMAAMHRLVHVPVFFIFAGITMFVRSYFGAGRMWLAAAIMAMRALLAVLGLMQPYGLFFSHLEGLRHFELPGGQLVAMPVGTLSPLHLLDFACLLSLFVFVVDAAWTTRRTATPQVRRRMLQFATAMGFYNLAILVHIPLVHVYDVGLPYLVGWSFLPTIIVMANSMGADLMQSARLASELQLSEASLRESEQRLAVAANASGVGLWTWNSDGRVLWHNEHACRLFDTAPSGDLQRFLARVHPDDAHQLLAAAHGELAGDRQDLDIRVLAPDGGQRWLAVRSFVAAGATGRSSVVRGAAIDITARRELEQEFRALREELAHLSRVTMLGELSGAIAHELNQPLAAILSNAQAAQRFLANGTGATEELEEILADIVDQDRRASEVIYRLRSLLRKGELSLEEINVNETVTDVLKLLRSDMINRKVNLQTDFAPDDPWARAARIQVQQVLVNLVVNACDALVAVTPLERQVCVRTRTRQDGFVLVMVEDNGAGIPAQDAARIFEPFVTTKEHGMGLGLAVCRTIVLAHGGQLWADSTVERGARICFTLPGA